MELPRGNKWYHTDRCKRFERNDELFIPNKVQTIGDDVTEDGPVSELPESHSGAIIQSTSDTEASDSEPSYLLKIR